MSRAAHTPKWGSAAVVLGVGCAWGALGAQGCSGPERVVHPRDPRQSSQRNPATPPYAEHGRRPAGVLLMGISRGKKVGKSGSMAARHFGGAGPREWTAEVTGEVLEAGGRGGDRATG